MNKAVFLDRDGVINRELDRYVCSPEEFEILPGVKEALRYWQDQGYLLFVVTNQGGIAKGLYSHDILSAIHGKLEDYLHKHGVYLREIYYSPHHPDHSNSLTRKPDSLLLERAIARHRIDPSRSFMIGDRPRDIEAAEKAGITGILVDSNDDLRKLLNIIN